MSMGYSFRNVSLQRYANALLLEVRYSLFHRENEKENMK
jgi:hypothetical protein